MNHTIRSILFPVRTKRSLVGASAPASPSAMSPSIMFPVVGLAAAYYLTRNKTDVMPWALAAGALAGLAINANLRTYQAQVAITNIGGDLGAGPGNAPSYGAQVVESVLGKPLAVQWSTNLIYSAAIDKAARQLPQVPT